MIGKIHITDRIKMVIYNIVLKKSCYNSYTLYSNQTSSIKLIYLYPGHTYEFQYVKTVYNTDIGEIIINLNNTYFECIKFIKVI